MTIEHKEHETWCTACGTDLVVSVSGAKACPECDLCLAQTDPTRHAWWGKEFSSGLGLPREAWETMWRLNTDVGVAETLIARMPGPNRIPMLLDFILTRVDVSPWTIFQYQALPQLQTKARDTLFKRLRNTRESLIVPPSWTAEFLYGNTPTCLYRLLAYLVSPQGGTAMTKRHDGAERRAIVKGFLARANHTADWKRSGAGGEVEAADQFAGLRDRWLALFFHAMIKFDLSHLIFRWDDTALQALRRLSQSHWDGQHPEWTGQVSDMNYDAVFVTMNDPMRHAATERLLLMERYKSAEAHLGRMDLPQLR